MMNELKTLDSRTKKSVKKYSPYVNGFVSRIHRKTLKNKQMSQSTHKANAHKSVVRAR